MTEELLKILKSLNSNLRLLILKSLCENDMDSQQIFFRLKGTVRYRQYIHRDLEILRKSGIIDKYYNYRDGKLYYHLERKKLIIDLLESSFEFSL